MDHPGFFTRTGPHSLSAICDACQAALTDAGAVTFDGGEEKKSPADVSLVDVRTLQDAGPSDLGFFDNRKYLPQLRETRAGACFVKAGDVNALPPGVLALVTPTPYHAFARALALFYPDAARPLTAGPVSGEPSADGSSLVSPDAEIEDGAIIEPGAVVAAGAQIGRGTRIASGAVIGYRVAIGRESYVGPNATVLHALVGDRVVIHQGVQIGQDGFGFAMGPGGHLRVPQIGRVIIQDDVDIGANSCIDRGALNDTIIGEGTKIDNLVQIGHNAVIGRHCVIVAHVGISGSAVLEDFVVLGGQVGVAGHIRVGAGAQVAAQSGVKDPLAAGGVYGGSPALPAREWARQIAAVKRLAKG
ncbi:MAG: UDP-3-O-(3-hydroxymyristoyl)glucosamine N-acyltransferase [Pseudomonadota bacterium]